MTITDPLVQPAIEVHEVPHRTEVSPVSAGRKVVYTLRVGKFSPEICSLTYPLLRAWAHKIGAEFEVITERFWPDYPICYEKLQIFYLSRGIRPKRVNTSTDLVADPKMWQTTLSGKESPNSWSIYVDSDTLVHPDFFDPTDHLDRATVCHNGKDMAGNRWRYDRFFRRDGRHIGSCNWFAVASDWCVDLWHPLDDLSLSEAVANIFPIVGERNTGLIQPDHLLDDYVLSRNIAKFGLKFTTIMEMCERVGRPPGFLFHLYNCTEEEKLVKIKKWLREMGIA